MLAYELIDRPQPEQRGMLPGVLGITDKTSDEPLVHILDVHGNERARIVVVEVEVGQSRLVDVVSPEDAPFEIGKVADEGRIRERQATVEITSRARRVPDGEDLCPLPRERARARCRSRSAETW